MFSRKLVPAAALLAIASRPCSAASGCPDDPELDLCDGEPEVVGHAVGQARPSLAILLAVGLGRAGPWSGGAAALLPLAALAGGASAGSTTCGAVKSLYASEECCGAPEKPLALPPSMTACPYNFAKPRCADAEPQAPRDLTPNAPGEKVPKAAVLNEEQAAFLPLVNVHFHLGAEHKSEAYSDGSASEAYDAQEDGGYRRLATDVRPGFMCGNMTSEETSPAYEFQYCKGDVQVGKSYEVHYVHSSAGYTDAELVGADLDGIDDGLGGAANGRGQLNPMIVVQGQVFQIVNGGEDVQDMLHGWTVVDHSDSVMYTGSTTGQSHDNEICSPYTITWHVDKACHKVSPESFDRLCQQMKEAYDLEKDLYPHGSRKILSPSWVVKPEYVKPLA